MGNDAGNDSADSSLTEGEGDPVIRPRRDGWQVLIYTGIDPVTGRQRQVKGSRKQAERVETKLKAEVLAGRHRGTRSQDPRRADRCLP